MRLTTRFANSNWSSNLVWVIKLHADLNLLYGSTCPVWISGPLRRWVCCKNYFLLVSGAKFLLFSSSFFPFFFLLSFFIVVLFFFFLLLFFFLLSFFFPLLFSFFFFLPFFVLLLFSPFYSPLGNLFFSPLYSLSFLSSLLPFFFSNLSSSLLPEREFSSLFFLLLSPPFIYIFFPLLLSSLSGTGEVGRVGWVGGACMRVESGNTWEGDDDFFSRLFIISRIIMGWLGWFVARERKDIIRSYQNKNKRGNFIFNICYFLFFVIPRVFTPY